MSIKLNAFEKGLEYNKEEYLNKFIPLVIKKAPKYDVFSVLDLHKALELNETELRIFKDLVFDIRVYLIDNGYAELKGTRSIKMIEKKDVNIIAENYIAGNNYGTQSSRSALINPVIQNDNKIIETKPAKRSLLEIASWFFGSIIAIIGIYEFIIKKIFTNT